MATTGTHESSNELLRSKAALLLRREEELRSLRMASDRVESWLDVFHALTDLIGIIDPVEIVSRSVSLLVGPLGFETAAVYRQEQNHTEFRPVIVQPANRTGGPIVLSGPEDPLLMAPGGIADATNEEFDCRIRDAIGAEKYFWISFPVGVHPHLLVAGFSAHSSAFHTLTASDAGHFAMFGNHLAALLNNAYLVDQVKNERAEIEAAAQELEKAYTQLAIEMDERERMEAELRLIQKLEAVGQLAAGIAHEINTPMQYIGDNLQFLSKAFDRIDPIVSKVTTLTQVEDPKVRADLLDEVASDLEQSKMAMISQRIPTTIANALDGVSAVSRIVRAMRDFSHPGTEDKQPVDLNHAVEASITVSRNEWKYVAGLEFWPDEGMPEIMGYAGEINQVLLNLIVNAAHAIAARWDGTGQLGTILIATAHDDDAAEITLRDDGTGIPADIIDRIFTPFFTTKAVGKGTGQGLALAHRVIVDRHGGELKVDSTVGEGSTFKVRLPRTI